MKDFAIVGKVSEKEFFEQLKDFPIVQKKEFDGYVSTTVEYINVSASYDTEVSSFYYNEEKCSCPYSFQIGINGRTLQPRNWPDFLRLMYRIKKFFGLSETRRLPIYVRNLSYEFQFIRPYYDWESIFAREERQPMKALTTDGFEFRCSYMLAGCSLEQTGKNLTKYKVQKKVGDLDYDLVRFPNTPLTKEEEDYCIFDTLVDMAYVQEEIEHYGDVTKIPMTNTGKVRMYCRERCFSKENKKSYRALMSQLTLNGVDEYNMLKEAFTAGYTHANWQNCGEVWTDVYSKDFTSSYPSVMVCEKMPMSRGEWVRPKNMRHIENMMKMDYYLIFNIEFGHIEEKPGIPDHYISLGRCHGVRGAKADNGRLIEADRIQMTITSDDWDIIKRCYNFKDSEIILGKCLRYELKYLPRVFVQCVLDFYRDKTTLKDIDEFVADYMLKKGMLNSCFGMAVTDIVNEEIGYDDEWISHEADPEKAIEEYNNSKNRFLFYPWGIAICSKARRNLWSGILELGDDYIYSDTDSVKYINPEKHEAYFKAYNDNIRQKMEKACKVNKLNIEDTRPKTVKGVEKPLGVWDDDGHYLRYKTLGAKRYLVETEDHKIKCTIAGANKKKASEYIGSKKDPFEFFSDNMSIDEEHSGRLVHTYIDEPFDFEGTDYLGNRYSGHELSGIHMSKSEYNLKLSPIYAALLGSREVRYH